ncbi:MULTISPECIES: hypothetical protein [unclassified Beijerinckia]|uniref:hypothetical protein n=1 Tax=unclassified Beijerinckia TaxID=2638183 RepID=UPI000897DBED|nr:MULTISPECIES: hypothetical protein [unclassified Beijerinckia]MDH7795452.1 hypothetical protein [Beijerinckia sp. GAS462]SEC02169.1 viral coat protein [Beijerinckia sp. 28-YEA-48]
MKYSAYIALYLDNSESCVIAATGISAILTACAPAVFARRVNAPRRNTWFNA